MKIASVLITLTMFMAVICHAGERMENKSTVINNHSWADSALAGKPVDISPWAYLWRADKAVQEKPEACFIPRRLDRIDKVYRTAAQALPVQDLKSIYYDMPDLLKPFPPKPKGDLLTGLLWTGGLVDYQVELHWPADAKVVPSPDEVEVRVYPTSFGWFGWTVDRILEGPKVSDDGRMWTFKSDPTLKMDTSYSSHVPAATEMVAVFCLKDKPAVPEVRITGPSVGSWRRMDIEIEWGFSKETRGNFDGWMEPCIAKIGPLKPIAGDTGTMTSQNKWKSKAAGEKRRGIVVPLLYAPESRPGMDSRVTLWSRKGGFTFRISDLEKGPILVPEQGVFIAKAGSKQSARGFIGELEAKKLKSLRQMTREHPEADSWDELMQEVRLWTCPKDTPVPPFPKVDEPPMQVQISDERWTGAWRAASAQLQGKHLWGGLAFEVGRVAHEMDMIGLHDEAEKIYEHFLQAPGAKPDGDYTDGDGALEWATSMRHDMGYSHDGTHASTGRLLFAMADRYFLTGDREWFQKNRARLEKAADWIVRQRTLYMKDVPNRNALFVKGLMPPSMLGDYALPSCDWHWYYVDNALSLQGLQRFADALMEIDPKAGEKYLKEAETFRKDLRRVVEYDAALSPVRLGRDGMYHSYIPRMPYAKGLTGPELGAPQFPDCDMFVGALALAEPFSAIDAGDHRMVDTLDVMEEMGMSAASVSEKEKARRERGLPPADAWFWNPFIILPKASHNADIFLLQDDVPSFLRSWLNAYASVVGADGKLWEHWHLGSFATCDTPDNGTAGWFMECFRDMLVMEEGRSLWIAKATPRSWLEQGKKISVKGAPTYFGTLAYEIVSDADNGKITATVDLPDRSPAKEVILRLRHPKSAKIKKVTVNGKAWKGFDPDREIIKLTGFTGKAVVVAVY